MAGDLRALKPGTLVHNRYRVEKTLGAGGFGVTYRATDLKYNQIVAMKEYMPLDAAYRPAGSVEVYPVSEDMRPQYEKFRQRFLEEAQTIYKFRGHPNIVEVKHLFYDNNTAYYVMEYVEGMDLRQFLEQQGGRMSWNMLRPIIAQVVSGLKQVHNGGMIHCDISPDNIFLVKSGSVKLLDFGAAKSTLRGMVETSMIVAKPGYSPYEQMRGKDMGPWTDVYALAVTIYRCITGKMIQDSQTRIVNDTTIWPSQMGIAIPSGQWELALKKGMALRIEDRFSNVMDLWQNMGGTPQDIGTVDAGNSAYVSGAYSAKGIVGVQGVMTGMQIPVKGEMLLGVDPTRCQILIPAGTPGISRVHLRVWSANGKIMAMDMKSTYGSWLDGKRMAPGLVYQTEPGSVLYLGGGQVFRVV